MIQEVINNIIRHADADTIYFNAKKNTGDLEIEISDNGKGFDPGFISPGVGLQNLKNRSKMINAGLSITSEHGTGSQVKILVKPDHYD